MLDKLASDRLSTGSSTTSRPAASAFARAAEEAGYAGLWSFETQHEAFLPLAVAATVTSKINLGTASNKSVASLLTRPSTKSRAV